MAKIIQDGQYVHAAAQDLVSAATPPSKWYFVGDVVKVDVRNGSNVDVKLTLADEMAGAFEGVVSATTDTRYMPGDDVSFNYHA